MKGSFRKLFTRSSSSNDDLKNEDESLIEEDSLHSVEPLRLEPIDTHHEEDEVPGEYQSFPTVTITIDNLPTNEEVVSESIDVAVVESVDYNLDFVDEDDDEVEEDNDGEIEDEEQPAAISEEDGREDDSLGKETDEEDTEIVPKRTVFRETLLNKKDDDEADDDELKDFREEGVAPNFIVQNVDDEQVSKGFVRSIPGKVKGSFRKLFTRSSSSNDDLKNEDESLIEEDSLHSVEPLRLEPIDTHHEEDEVPGEYQSFPTVTITIDNLPTNEEVVSESIDVAVVESVDYNLDFVDEDDDEVEEDNDGEIEDEEQPAAISEEDGREDDSLGKETDEEDTEIVPKRTVFRETLLNKKDDDEADDDELKDFREEGVAPNFIVQNVDDEQVSKGFVRSIPGKVKGSFRKLFTRSSSSNDDLKNEDESLIEEDSLHSVEPLRLEPIDTHHEEDEVPGEYQSFPTVTITIDNLPTNEEVVSESIDVAVVESVDYNLDFVDEDDDEVEEDNDGEVEDEEQPAAISEEDGKEDDSLGKETDEEDTEIVPKRTVFRETLLNKKDDDEADDDELKDFREEGVAPNFIVQNVDDEQVSKGFVRSIPGKVKGSFRKLFTRSSSSNDDLKNEDESLIEEDSLHSVEPLRLEPIDTHHEEDEVPGEYQSFPTVTITIDNLPTNEEVVSESIDVAVVESVDYNLDFVDEDDDEVEEDNDGEVEDEEQPAAISEEDGEEDDSLGKETDEEDTEIVPKRTVFRETLLNTKDDDEADDDELKDFREEGVAPNFIVQNVDDEQISKGFVRSIPGKVKGSFRKLFTRSSSSNDDLKNEDESLIEEDSLHSVEPFRLEPIDTHHEEDEVPGEYQSFPTVTITIDNPPTNEEVVSESIDVAVVESVDYNLDFVDEDDDEVEEDNDGEIEDEEQPAAISEEDGREDDSLGKETDEEDTEIVPKRTVFRETLLNKKDDDEADDDELKDFREEGVAPNFIVQNVDDEQVSKGFVRSIPGKVKGSFRKLFTRSSSSNDDLKNEDESLIEEDSLHSVEPLRLEPIDTHHEEDEVPGEYQSFPTVTITIDNLPTNEEVVSESIDVAVVESVDYNLDFVDEDDDEVEEDNDGEIEDEEQPAAISEEDGREDDSLGKETDEEDTEIVPKRTVFRETLLNKKDDDEADDDELKDFREEGVAPNFIVQNVDDEQISKGFVRSIPGKVKGSFRKLFTRSSSSNDDLKNEDESLIEEDSLHSVEPFRLEPIDTHHEEDEVPGEYQSFPTVTITIDNPPTNEEVVSESIDVAVVESVDYNLDFVDEDDDEVEEDNDGEVEDEEQPAAISEEDGREDDSLGKETDEEDTEIVPKRTVFRETLLNKKDDDEADDDELKDFREEGVAPNFIVQNVDDEQISKGFVRSIPGKVKGSFRKLFTRSSSSNDDLKNEDESLIEEDSLHSVEPLRLEPIDTHHEEDEVPGEYQSFPTVTITIDNLPTNEEVVSESIDVAVVESVDYNLDFVDEDDDEVEEDNDGEIEDEEQPAAISEEDGREDDSLGKETDEEDTEIVPKRTVFRETLLNKKDDDEADDDELKDFREEGVAPNFIVQNVDDEQVSKGFVRSIPGKVKGSFRKLFTRSSSSNDDLKNEDESLIEEDSLHSVEPLRLEPIDRETLLNKKDDDEADDDELKDFREEGVAPNFIVQNVDDEQVSKGFVRSIPGKVKGSFRKLFTRSSSSNDDLKNEDESLIEEDSLHSVEPLRLEPIDTHHEEDEVPGEYQSFPTVTITIDNLPTNEEVVSESIDVAVVESVDYNLDFVDEDDDEVEEDNDGEVEDEEQPAAISEEDGREDDSLGKETDEEDTEIVPKRTVFRETLLNKKDDDEADDDELKDFREEGVAPNFIVQNVDDEQVSKGFVRSIPGKVKGSFRKLFTRSSSSNDDLKNEDESLIEEDSLHSVEPLRLEPIDTHHEEDEVPGEYQSFPTVTITIDNLPTNEEVVSESIDVAVVESVDYNLDFVDEDDDEVEEDNDGEVEDEEQPAAISEEDGEEDDSLGKETDEEDTEIVPKRTVFRETLLNTKDDDEADDDELKDFREEGVAPNFIVQNVDDEQISKGFVRSIPGKVKGSFRKLFTRSSSSNDDLKNEDESLIEEDSLHSVEPFRLEPIDTHHEEDEVPGEYQSFPTVTITIDNPPTNEEVVSESIDVAVVESVDYNLDFVDEDDDEVEEDNDGEIEDEEQPAAISEEDGREDDSLGKETDEEDTEIVPKRTVFRETLLNKKDDDEADDDELRDFREEGVAPNFIVQNVDDEQVSKGFVRSIPGKVKGSFRKLFTRSSSSNDDLKNEDESLIEEDSLHSVEPLRLEPIDTHHEEDEVPGEYQSFPTVTITIDNLPTNEEVVSESIDVAVVESVDYNLDFVDEDDDEVEEDNDGGVEDEEQPAAISEEDGREDDSLGKETDEEDTEIVPKRTVFRETLLNKKDDDEADDDELKDFREEGVAPNFIVQNVDDEKISKGFVRSIPGKVKGSFRKLFTRSSSSNDDLKNEDESLIEEDSLHSVEPLRLEPIDTHHEEDEVPGEYQSFPTVIITIDNLPTNEEVVSESIDVAVVESVDYNLDFVDEDDDEVEEDNDGEVEDEEQPAAISEEDGKEDDSLGKETDEEDTEIVPKRTVFRETLLNKKDDDEADDDELKDFREEGVAPNFIVQNVDDEQISKGFVRSIPGKVKGSFRKLFTRSSSSNDDLKNEDESLIEEDSLHSVEPLRLEPIDTHHEEDEVPGEYQSFPTVTITIDNLPTNEEVVSESIDVAVVESVDYNLDFVDEDDDEVEEDNDGEVEDEEQPAAINEKDGREDDSLGKETDEEDTENGDVSSCLVEKSLIDGSDEISSIQISGKFFIFCKFYDFVL